MPGVDALLCWHGAAIEADTRTILGRGGGGGSRPCPPNPSVVRLNPRARDRPGCRNALLCAGPGRRDRSGCRNALLCCAGAAAVGGADAVHRPCVRLRGGESQQRDPLCWLVWGEPAGLAIEPAGLARRAGHRIRSAGSFGEGPQREAGWPRRVALPTSHRMDAGAKTRVSGPTIRPQSIVHHRQHPSSDGCRRRDSTIGYDDPPAESTIHHRQHPSSDGCWRQDCAGRSSASGSGPTPYAVASGTQHAEA